MCKTPQKYVPTSSHDVLFMVRWLLVMSNLTEERLTNSSLNSLTLYWEFVFTTSCSFLPVVTLYHTVFFDALFMKHLIVAESPIFTVFKDSGWETSLNCAAPEIIQTQFHTNEDQKFTQVNLFYLHKEQSRKTFTKNIFILSPSSVQQSTPNEAAVYFSDLKTPACPTFCHIWQVWLVHHHHTAEHDWLSRVTWRGERLKSSWPPPAIKTEGVKGLDIQPYVWK